MAKTEASTKPDRKSAELSALPQGDRSSGPTTKHPIALGAGSGPSLWTVYEDYFATGQGRALITCITWAASEQEARSRFAKTFDPWYAKGCDALSGVVGNEITLLLWSVQPLDLVESVSGRRAAVNFHGLPHFNFS